MGVRSLAEAIILQSLEDLSYPQYRDESREFFTGDGFKICGDIAELNSLKKLKIIHIAKGRKNVRTAGVHRA